MSSVRIRFILTGSCHPYSGRQVFFVVPLESSGGPTTVADVKDRFVRQRWPKELASVFEGREVSLKILKNGRLLSDDTPLRDSFSSEELEHCVKRGDSVPVSGRGDADQAVSESSALMHLVFSVPLKPLPQEAPRAHEAPVAKKQAQADSGCGCAML